VDRPLLMGLVLLLLIVLLALMFWGWRKRQRSQSGVVGPEAVPADIGDVHGSFDGLYVATTVAGEPLNRITVRGLGFRSRASVTVAADGIVVALRGEPEAWISTTNLREVTRATWTIDRVVEDGGLVLIAWTLGDGETATAVDSYFRLDRSPELLDAINLIFPVSTGRKA